MKPDDFKKIVKAIVQEEVKKQLPILIPKVLTQILLEKSQNSDPVPVPTVQKTVQAAPVQQPRPVDKPQKKYSNNPLLNAVLNETTIKIPHDPTEPMVRTEPMESSRQANIPIADDTEAISFSELTESYTPPQIASVTNITPVNETQEKVIGMLNRDFRGMMKRIDQHKKAGISPFGGSGPLSFDAE